MAEVPSRGPALSGKRMLLTFDIDCGEVVDGHRFIARGLADCGTIEAESSAQGFSLEMNSYPECGL